MIVHGYGSWAKVCEVENEDALINGSRISTWNETEREFSFDVDASISHGKP